MSEIKYIELSPLAFSKSYSWNSYTWIFSLLIMVYYVVQLKDAWTVNHAVDGSSPSCFKLTKSLQQAFNPKIAEPFGSRPKLGGSVYHNNIVGTLKIHLYPLYIEQMLRLPGAVSPDVLHNASLRITLTVPKVGGTKNEVTSNLPFLLNSKQHR